MPEPEPAPAATRDEIELCGTCDQLLDNCECCSCCERAPCDCECSICERCEDRFDPERSESCCSEYCSHRCAERDNHYHCGACGDTVGENSYSCEDCGYYDCCREMCSTDDCNRCTHCCSCGDDANTQHAAIRASNCREYPAANPATQKPTDLGIGVELEIECKDDTQVNTVAAAISDKHHAQLLLKEDGSLNDGFELVTGRCSLAVHQAMWPEIAKTTIAAGGRSWNHTSTGLHVHLSRAWFTPLTLGKFLVFINSEATRPCIVKLAGRSCPNYAKLSKKKLTDSKHSEGRYEAVNLTNSATIEVRIFKGTLHVGHILADIEFCHAAAMWAAKVSCKDCDNWESFMVYVRANRKEYKNLINFMAAKITRDGEGD